MNNKAILVISFGTFYEETRKKTIEAIEEDLKQAFPKRAFYRAWTSRMLIARMKNECGIQIDTPAEAMARMAADGITDVLVQPTLLLEGQEYDKKILAELDTFRASFGSVKLGRPLLSTVADRHRTADVLGEIFAPCEEDSMLIFMGHGSPGDERHPINICYDDLNSFMIENGRSDMSIGLVEASPTIEDIRNLLKRRKIKKVTLTPLMIVAGDHALNDMSGDEDDSWKTLIESDGIKVDCILKGIGEYPAIRNLFVSHAKDAE